ncbi:hypothetical protein VOLCADRAFT_98048 [Volvox carteri f. nagariensis]|uniref:Uncharacterized protein n=1 Tax=Volvox carteri f. nagariensis TaxID=3068 RepID=D8UEB1_VOLCA|nr:uncharacterized protein VOLCADRAFT_98048 [Volvox carteri f. nagariensis]EFJ41972.1 hypothetical protein VOLCADRAFT_98048 [Volvox carteri f. nagariensis]|eukprot:XP_002957009.1 hypothetical protein VOLCADRAFT_98048 [Volvox carteri f. nagariensis]
MYETRRRFRWRLNFIRLAFRFNAADGLFLTFQQWLFQIGDVDRIRANAKKLAAMDEAASAKNKDKVKKEDRKAASGKNKDIKIKKEDRRSQDMDTVTRNKQQNRSSFRSSNEVGKQRAVQNAVADVIQPKATAATHQQRLEAYDSDDWQQYDIPDRATGESMPLADEAVALQESAGLLSATPKDTAHQQDAQPEELRLPTEDMEDLPAEERVPAEDGISAGEEEAEEEEESAEGTGVGEEVEEEEEEEDLLPTGETPDEWFNRIVEESEETARRALGRIPLESSTEGLTGCCNKRDRPQPPHTDGPASYIRRAISMASPFRHIIHARSSKAARVARAIDDRPVVNVPQKPGPTTRRRKVFSPCMRVAHTQKPSWTSSIPGRVTGDQGVEKAMRTFGLSDRAYHCKQMSTDVKLTSNDMERLLQVPYSYYLDGLAFPAG